MRPEQASAEPPGWETIEELFAALESALLSYALRLAGDRTVAEDIVQETFMRLHAQFDQVRKPRRWLYRTAQFAGALAGAQRLTTLGRFERSVTTPAANEGPHLSQQL